MNSRRPGSSRGPTRPGARTKTARASEAKQTGTSGEPRLKAGSTRRSLVFGGASGKPRTLSLRALAIALSIMGAIILVAPTLSSYLDQQQQLRDVNASVDEAQARIRALESEALLWSDDEYVTAQARERLGYVKPGQILYMVNDPEAGTAEDEREALEVELEYNRRAATPWFTTMWDSVTVAGYSSGEADTPADEKEDSK